MRLVYQAASDGRGTLAGKGYLLEGKNNETGSDYARHFGALNAKITYDFPGSKAAIWLACCAIGESGNSVLISV